MVARRIEGAHADRMFWTLRVRSKDASLGAKMRREDVERLTSDMKTRRENELVVGNYCGGD
jgi:hypothetical protein